MSWPAAAAPSWMGPVSSLSEAITGISLLCSLSACTSIIVTRVRTPVTLMSEAPMLSSCWPGGDSGVPMLESGSVLAGEGCWPLRRPRPAPRPRVWLVTVTFTWGKYLRSQIYGTTRKSGFWRLPRDRHANTHVPTKLSQNTDTTEYSSTGLG